MISYVGNLPFDQNQDSEFGEEDSYSLALTLFGLSLTQGAGVVITSLGSETINPFDLKNLTLTIVAIGLLFMSYFLVAAKDKDGKHKFTEESTMFNKLVFWSMLVVVSVIYVSGVFGALPYQVKFDSATKIELADNSPGVLVKLKISKNTLQQGATVICWLDDQTVEEFYVLLSLVDKDGDLIKVKPGSFQRARIEPELEPCEDGSKEIILNESNVNCFRFTVKENMTKLNYCYINMKLVPREFDEDTFDSLGQKAKNKLINLCETTKTRLMNEKPIQVVEVKK